jgi:hypothetical protein
LAAIGPIEQVRLTVPEYPFVPAMLIVEVFPVVAPGSTVMFVGEADNVKLGVEVTVSITVAD